MDNHILKRVQRFFALFVTGTLLFGLTSCVSVAYQAENDDEIENIAEVMRPMQGKDIEIGNHSANTEILPDEAVTEKKTEIHVSILGDILLDGQILYDAASRAGEGMSYNFLTMYTGIYRTVKDADIAMCSYSTAAAPVNPWSVSRTPIESLAALSSVGFDILETTGSADRKGEITDYSMKAISASHANKDAVVFIEKEGITLGFLSLGGTGYTQSYLTNSYKANLEYATMSADVVVVSVDWDKGTSTASMKEIAKDIAMAGADVIVGNSKILGSVDWIDCGNGAKTLVAYSLGNLLSTSAGLDGLCGGVLSFTVTEKDGTFCIGGVFLDPTISFYNAAGGNYLVKAVKDCEDSLLSQHGVWGMTRDKVLRHIHSSVGAEFLPAEVRG